MHAWRLNGLEKTQMWTKSLTEQTKHFKGRVLL